MVRRHLKPKCVSLLLYLRDYERLIYTIQTNNWPSGTDHDMFLTYGVMLKAAECYLINTALNAVHV